jgi:hypothetical protein
MTPVSIAHMLRLLSIFCKSLFMGRPVAIIGESRCDKGLNSKKRNEYAAQAAIGLSRHGRRRGRFFNPSLPECGAFLSELRFRVDAFSVIAGCDAQVSVRGRLA